MARQLSSPWQGDQGFESFFLQRGVRCEPDLVPAGYVWAASGTDVTRNEPGFFRGEIAKGRGSDTAIILYTSGTTGQPKGVVLSFDNIITTARNAIAFEGLTDREEVLAYLPMPWVGEHIFPYAQAYCAGFCASCPESQVTVMLDLRELGPTYFFEPPRIFESILTQVMIRMEDAGWAKRRLFHFFLDFAKRVGPPEGVAILQDHENLNGWLARIEVQTNPARACPREGGGRRTSGNRAHPGRHAAANQTPWPSCSATWRGWALLSARSERSRTLARND